MGMNDPYTFQKNTQRKIQNHFAEILTHLTEMEQIYIEFDETKHAEFITLYKQGVLSMWESWSDFWSNA